MVDVFDEVEEQLRQERYQSLLRTWGPWVGAGALAVVVSVAGYQYWQWRSGAQAAEASDQYMSAAAAFEEGNLGEADSEFAALAETGPRGYAALALLRRGELALQQGQAEEAARLFEQAAERAPEPVTRDLARYKAALARFEGLSYDDLTVRLRPLTEGAAPFGALARELIGAAAMREERWDEARRIYQLLSVGLDAPQGVSRRATEALSYIDQNAPAPLIPEVSAADGALAPDAGAGEVGATPAPAEPAVPDDEATAAPEIQDEENGR